MSDKKKKNQYSSIAWYNTNYWLLNGFLLPELAYSAISDLILAGRVKGLDAALREAIRNLIAENTAVLVRTNAKWTKLLGEMDEAFKENAAAAKPDNAGAENLRLLEKMYTARAKAEKN
jgi:hypothetical protein